MLINVIDKDTIIVTSSNNRVKKFKRKDMTGPEKVWLDNIIACTVSLTKTPL